MEAGRGRKPGVKTSGKSGVVKAAAKRTSTANRIFYIVIALVAIGGIGALTFASTRTKEGARVSPVDTTLPPVKSEGYVIGSASAPLEVIEFGDFECPVCSQFATVTEPDVRSRLVNAGRIRLRYIDFPLPMHPNTWNASRAAACADEQGKFWQMHDALFQTQDQWSGASGNTKPDAFFKKLAKQTALNTGQFNGCVDTKKYQAKIQAHYKIAEQRQVHGTPTFQIGDKMVMEPLTYDQFRSMVDEALAKVGTPTPAVGGDTARSGPLAKPKR